MTRHRQIERARVDRRFDQVSLIDRSNEARQTSRIEMKLTGENDHKDKKILEFEMREKSVRQAERSNLQLIEVRQLDLVVLSSLLFVSLAQFFHQLGRRQVWLRLFQRMEIFFDEQVVSIRRSFRRLIVVRSTVCFFNQLKFAQTLAAQIRFHVQRLGMTMNSVVNKETSSTSRVFSLQPILLVFTLNTPISEFVIYVISVFH